MKTLNEVLETLRGLAEEFTAEAAGTRRPSWAPALIVSEEFLELVRHFNLLPAGDKPVARLWAHFRDPRQRGTVLRNNIGLTLSDVKCRGFDLHVGTKRQGPSLFRARRSNDDWSVNSTLGTIIRSKKEYALTKQRAQRIDAIYNTRWSIKIKLSDPVVYPLLSHQLKQQEAELAELDRALVTAGEELSADNAKRDRLVELAKARVLEFGGLGTSDTMTQMVAGTRVTRTCCICGALLTDVVSVEYGIGPVCRQKNSRAITEYVACKLLADAPEKSGEVQQELPL